MHEPSDGLVLVQNKTSDKPPEKRHNMSTLEQLLHSDQRDSVLSENKYKRASKGNFVLIERRGGKDDLFATEIDPNSSPSVVSSKDGGSFLHNRMSQRHRRPSEQASLIDSMHESADLPDPDSETTPVSKEVRSAVPDGTETKEDTSF